MCTLINFNVRKVGSGRDGSLEAALHSFPFHCWRTVEVCYINNINDRKARSWALDLLLTLFPVSLLADNSCMPDQQH